MPEYCCLCGTESAVASAVCIACRGTVFQRRYRCRVCSRLQCQSACMTCRTRNLAAKDATELLQGLMEAGEHLQAWDLAGVLQQQEVASLDPLVIRLSNSRATFQQNVRLWMQGSKPVSDIAADPPQHALLRQLMVLIRTSRGFIAVPLVSPEEVISPKAPAPAPSLLRRLVERYVPGHLRSRIPPLLQTLRLRLLELWDHLAAWQRNWLHPRLARMTEAGETWCFRVAEHPVIQRILPMLLRRLWDAIAAMPHRIARSRFLNRYLPDVWRAISGYIIRIPHAVGQSRQPGTVKKILDQPVRLMLRAIRSKFLREKVPASVRYLRQRIEVLFLRARRSRLIAVILPNWLNRAASMLRHDGSGI